MKYSQSDKLKLLVVADDFYKNVSISFFCVQQQKEEKRMLNSIALIMLLGMLMGYVCKKIHLPSLTGMILTGIVLGPSVLNLIDSSLIGISSDLRRIALIIILTRAGLSLDLADLKKIGRSK